MAEEELLAGGFVHAVVRVGDTVRRPRASAYVHRLLRLLEQGGEVVCHHDLSPKNTVYVDGRPVAFLDWDLAGPGERVQDVAHACWQYVGLGPDRAPADAAGQVRLIADAYGLADRAGLVPAILWWQDRCWRGIEAGADAGDPAMVRLWDAGAVRAVRAAHDWTAAHRAVLGLEPPGLRSRHADDPRQR